MDLSRSITFLTEPLEKIKDRRKKKSRVKKKCCKWERAKVLENKWPHLGQKSRPRQYISEIRKEEKRNSPGIRICCVSFLLASQGRAKEKNDEEGLQDNPFLCLPLSTRQPFFMSSSLHKQQTTKQLISLCSSYYKTTLFYIFFILQLDTPFFILLHSTRYPVSML